ncbi:hypothetical protein HYX13_04780 [Candidatus Woesearchaeota archaeon]|nr:hypothetical protein [Candidatus Woesearchaeota archaeon]
MKLFEEPQEDLEYLAQKNAQLPVHSLVLLLQLLSQELQRHAQKDRYRGRPMRSLALRYASVYLATTGNCFSSSSRSTNSSLSGASSSETSDISAQEVKYRAYTLSRLRYGQLAEFFSSMATVLEQQKQYVVSGYLKEAQSRLIVAEMISPQELLSH